MSSLTDKRLDQTYDGLIKTSDEEPINGSPKNLQDGLGNDLPMQVSTSEIRLTGDTIATNLSSNQLSVNGYGEVINAAGEWTGEPVSAPTGSIKYLLRLEYDEYGALITANTTFVDVARFSTEGATIVSQNSFAGGSTGHNVNLRFGQPNPPTTIIGYGWVPVTSNYKMTHLTLNDMYYSTIGADFTDASTLAGGSGQVGQWSGATFIESNNYTFNFTVDKPTLGYGDAVEPPFTPSLKLPHAYLIFAF